MLQIAPFARALVRVVKRRWRHGPRRPSWSLPVELALDMFRERLLQATSLDPIQFRQEQDAFAASMPSRALKKLTRRPERLGGVDGEWLIPPGAAGESALLYLHGGAYVMGSVNTHGDLMAMLALKSGVQVFAANYRLAPEHPYPAAIDDAEAVYEALLAKGLAPGRLVVAGDSAGGGLSLALLLRLRAAKRPMPGGAVLISPWVDLTGGSASPTSSIDANSLYDFGDRKLLDHWANIYRGSFAAHEPLISPLFAELHGLPPLCVFAGEVEMLLDQIRAFVDRARAAGVEVDYVCAPDLAHVYPMLHLISRPAADAIEHAARFVKSHAS